jgi:hypothetical protein
MRAPATGDKRSSSARAQPEYVVHQFYCGHVLEALGRVRSAAIGCADAPSWSLSDADLVACLVAAYEAEQALAAVRLHLIRQADARGIPAGDHATSCASWLRHRLRVSGPAAQTYMTLARAVDERPGLDQALTVGALNTEQAAVIDRCVRALPAEVGVEAVAKAEALLIGWAADFGPRELRMLGARILEYVAPEVAEAADAAALRRLKARAHERRTFTVGSADSEGRVRMQGWLDAEAGAIVTAALDPLCSPRRPFCPSGPLAPDGEGADLAGDAAPGDA